MYYYILESPTNRGIRQTYQRLRDILTNLGIAGEIVAASPARKPDELAQMGVQKGYTTIVAVGGDSHINQVATSIIGQAVLGVIPINASQEVTELIGTNDLYRSAESLKFRRLSTVSTVLLEPEQIIFLDAQMKSERLAKLSLILDNKLRAYAYFNQVTIHKSLELDISSEHLTEPRRILGLFKSGGNVITSVSHFHAKVIKVVTEPELPLTIAGTPIAKTPFQLRLIPDSLKIITKRGSIV